MAAIDGTNLELPPIESLTSQSDFTPFMRPDVPPLLRSAAMRKLFADPHFNVMDGLDVYIDDYSKPSPIAPDAVRLLRHAKYILAPPPTRVNALGFVEDLPEAEVDRVAPKSGESVPAGDDDRAPRPSGEDAAGMPSKSAVIPGSVTSVQAVVPEDVPKEGASSQSGAPATQIVLPLDPLPDISK